MACERSINADSPPQVACKHSASRPIIRAEGPLERRHIACQSTRFTAMMRRMPAAARIALSLAVTCLGTAQVPAGDRAAILAEMDSSLPRYGDLSRRLWDFAELGYKETQSARLLINDLRANGFRVQEGTGGIPTAFVAVWGSGRPVIGILGEYDALPGMGQETVPVRRAPRPGAPGHACGHNLLGPGGAMAAVAVKNYLMEKRLGGTIRFYGTPAEEGGAGKVYMARAGAFDGLDAAIMWHPSSSNRADLASGLAITGGRFRFRGQPAHAAAAPWAGRSALDAAMLMGHAVDMLREHIPPEARVHYIVSNGGGRAERCTRARRNPALWTASADGGARRDLGKSPEDGAGIGARHRHGRGV
ncbi:MAG: amidohydrolase [Acidobacteria bacterium]|nr:amidohydrolase [Acidobacteriota bacterium]